MLTPAPHLGLCMEGSSDELGSHMGTRWLSRVRVPPGNWMAVEPASARKASRGGARGWDQGSGQGSKEHVDTEGHERARSPIGVEELILTLTLIKGEKPGSS